MNSLRALLRLKKMPNLGDTSIKKLIQTIGSAEEVLLEKKANLLTIPGIGAHKIKGFDDPNIIKIVDSEMHFIEKEKINCIHFQDDNYPFLLKQCIDSPVILFTVGNYNVKKQKIISIVGTRKVSKHGIQFCKEIVAALKPYNPIIVSGFAYGTDITAHKAALEEGLQTIACLGHGLNQIYPKSHKRYMADVESNGGFFTDFISTDKFIPQNFLRRNRIIAGMSEATIVIESADKGGSLATAQMAHSYDREVFAVPGRYSDALSMGCNKLIKNHQAHLLTNIEDIVTNLNWDSNENHIQPQLDLFPKLNKDEEKVYNFLKQHGSEHIDNIAIDCDLPMYMLSSLLLNLELKNVIRPLPGKLFELI